MTEHGTCTKCGKDRLGHPMSYDSVGEGYVDPEAGDFLCHECAAMETKRQAEKNRSKK